MKLQEFAREVILEPARDADRCIIWLHGLGADGYDFASVAQHMERRMALDSTRFIFPHAPMQPVTMAAGETMRSWYDILSASPRRTVDDVQLQHSVDRILGLIQQQITLGIDARRIVLAGFSQGGAVVYETARQAAVQLGGLVALSTYIPLGTPNDPLTLAPANAQLPVFIAHGDQDGVVPIALGKEALTRFQHHQQPPQWRQYPMQHEVCVAEINDLCEFLQHCCGG